MPSCEPERCLYATEKECNFVCPKNGSGTFSILPDDYSVIFHLQLMMHPPLSPCKQDKWIPKSIPEEIWEASGSVEVFSASRYKNVIIKPSQYGHDDGVWQAHDIQIVNDCPRDGEFARSNTKCEIYEEIAEFATKDICTKYQSTIQVYRHGTVVLKIFQTQLTL
uniref:Uncharacterized protein n=1 Tax=Acrobeloides nanus TaxID=290746 RepID=A0A914DXD2_9BILA